MGGFDGTGWSRGNEVGVYTDFLFVAGIFSQ